MDLIIPSYNEILPNLYISNFIYAFNYFSLKNLGITLIVNCAKQAPNMYPNTFSYYNIPVDDNITQNKEMYDYLKTTVDYIGYSLSHNRPVLIHCMAGISRSASVMAAYLIKYKGYTIDEAITFIRSKRPKTFYNGTNIIFYEALEKYYYYVKYNVELW